MTRQVFEFRIEKPHALDLDCEPGVVASFRETVEGDKVFYTTPLTGRTFSMSTLNLHMGQLDIVLVPKNSSQIIDGRPKHLEDWEEQEHSHVLCPH